MHVAEHAVIGIVQTDAFALEDKIVTVQRNGDSRHRLLALLATAYAAEELAEGRTVADAGERGSLEEPRGHH